MRDRRANRSVAVKQMPNWWMTTSHEAFVMEHPKETELPWQDIGCTFFLNSVGYDSACQLYDVFRGSSHTFVTMSFAPEGDLFSWSQVGPEAGPEREALVIPLALQVLTGVKKLHDMGIVHRDISLENILLMKSQGNSGGEEIKIIDFGMASSGRMFQRCVRGKSSYQAPEMHKDDEYDAFLSDTFSVGVTLYCMLLMDYPWLSTKPGGCKRFEYVEKLGFRAYIAKQRVRGSNWRISERMSEPVQQFLEGMLSFDPSSRLTLGEKDWPRLSCRKSVWDEPWIKPASKVVVGPEDKLVPSLPRYVSL